MATGRTGPTRGAEAHRTVGILGGMGPEATVDLMARILRATPAQDDRDHVRLLVDQNPGVPSRIAALLEGTGESPGPTLAAMARRLVEMGADALAMPCNTAHAYAGAIAAAAAPAPFIDMVGLAAAEAAARVPAGGQIGLLASTAVHLTGLYEAALGARGLSVRAPADQDGLMETIRAVKRGRADAAARAALRAATLDLRANGADLVVVACTELSVIGDALPGEVAAVDAMDLLAGAIVAYGKGGALPADGAVAGAAPGPEAARQGLNKHDAVR